MNPNLNQYPRGFCPVCGWRGRIVIPQHAEPKTGLTCKYLSKPVKEAA